MNVAFTFHEYSIGVSVQLFESDAIDRIFNKLVKKDKLQFGILSRKIKEILENPQIGKSLTANMTGQRRVHIRNFVLTYEVLENEKTVRLLDYDHHDNIY